MNEQILDLMEQYVKQEVQTLPTDLATLEQLTWQTILSFGKALLQRLVSHQPNGYQGSSIPCECGQSMRFIDYRGRDIHTLLGWIRLERAYYHCQDCGGGLAPYDKISGLGSQQLSPVLAKTCCLLAVDDSFSQVSRKLGELLGQKVCDDTIKQVVHQAGKVALQQQDKQLGAFVADRQIPPSQDTPERLYIAADGTTVHETDGWHEVKVGCIYRQDEHFESNKCYVAGFYDSQSFGWHLWLEACRCGLREAKEVVYIGDGAGWIRKEFDEHFSRATFIIDWYHASEHVWSCGKALFGEGTDSTDRWVNERLSLLWDGYTKKLLDDLSFHRKRCRGARRKAIDALYRYISTNEKQMRYDVFRAKGYDIGSGVVEGACKNVVGKRLKQSGMIWSRAGSSATLALRITWLNKRWDVLWLQKPLAA